MANHKLKSGLPVKMSRQEVAALTPEQRKTRARELGNLRQAAHKKRTKSKQAKYQAERRAAKAGARTYTIPNKNARRDLQRFVEHKAGESKAMAARQRRVAAAEARVAAGGSERPKRPDPKRGGKGFALSSYATEGHTTPLSRVELSPTHKTGVVVAQSKPANLSQGKRTLREWDTQVLRPRGLTVHPARPTEVTKLVKGIGFKIIPKF